MSAPATAGTAAPPLLAVRDLRVDFRVDAKSTVAAVRGASFTVGENETVAIVGESGSGKSVTALAIMDLLPADSARVSASSAIVYRGNDLRTLPRREVRRLRGREIAMVFQEPMSSLNPVFTVGFQLAEVLTQHVGLARRDAWKRALELLREVGIPEPEQRMRAYPFELSGGQQQRVMIAMAIACEPRLLIADEPTTALDVTVQKQILELLREVKRRHGMSMLFITHDLALVPEIADRVVVMRAGEVKEEGRVETVFAAPRDAYTRALLACRPRPDRRRARLPVIEDFIGGQAQPPVAERPHAPTGSEETLLEARALSKTFVLRDGFLRKRALHAVRNASFRLARGKTLGVVGESGSGKTTLAMMLVRLQQPTSGDVLLEGRDLLTLPREELLAAKRRIQIVFQNPYASLNPRYTAGQLLMEPMRIHAIGANDAERRAMAGEMLHKVGLPQRAFFKYPHEFSGGERQRIAIARCLTIRPEVLICDESVSALDVSIQAQLLNLLQDLQDEYGLAYLFVSHDLAVVRHMSDEIMVMKDGEIVEIGGADEIYAAPRHPYTQRLLSAMPRVPAADRLAP